MTTTASKGMSDAELSALVAEKVMGWTRRIDIAGPHWNDSRGCRHYGVHAFATDSGLALEAALKMNLLSVRIYPGPECFQSDVTVARGRSFDAVGTTVARALCFASLRAANQEVQDDSQ